MAVSDGFAMVKNDKKTLDGDLCCTGATKRLSIVGSGSKGGGATYEEKHGHIHRVQSTDILQPASITPPFPIF